MKQILSAYYFSMLIVLFLLLPGCVAKEDENEENEKEIISNQIRAELTGDLVYTTRNNQVMKTTFHENSIMLGNSKNPPRWSQDGNLLAFIENDNENIKVKIFNKNGNEEKSWVLLPSIQSDGINPLAWSPDGNTLAILNRLTEIIYLNVFTGEKSIIQIGQEEIPARSIAWCPKNNKIAISQFIGYFGENSKSITLIDAFENNPKKELLVYTEEFVEYMDWNADGSKLVYSGFGYGSVFTINSDGSENQKIITKGVFKNEPVYGCAPCWMPDGQQIIYEGVTGTEGSTLIPGLFVTEPEGAYNVNIKIEGKKPDCH